MIVIKDFCGKEEDLKVFETLFPIKECPWCHEEDGKFWLHVNSVTCGKCNLSVPFIIDGVKDIEGTVFRLGATDSLMNPRKLKVRITNGSEDTSVEESEG